MKTTNGKQSGFTIIELVVVILLLGILAATALPRFIDVTDDAREAVVQATASAMTTGAALYRAQWTAEGSVAGATPGTGTGPGGTNLFALSANTSGYPNLATDTPADCMAIYGDLLQTGAPEATATAADPVCTFALGESGSYGSFEYNVTTGQTTISP